MINLPGLADLQRLIATLQDAHSRVLQLGDPSRLAGDPGGIRRLADAHRSTAGALRATQDDGRAQTVQVTSGGLWEGTASVGFTRSWSEMHSRIGDLASRHDQLAVSLDGVAAESHRLNADAMDTLEAIGSWLGRAAEGLLRMDQGEIGGLVDGGGIILSDLQRLLAELEHLARKAAQLMTAELGF